GGGGDGGGGGGREGGRGRGRGGGHGKWALAPTLLQRQGGQQLRPQRLGRQGAPTGGKRLAEAGEGAGQRAAVGTSLKMAPEQGPLLGCQLAVKIGTDELARPLTVHWAHPWRSIALRPCAILAAHAIAVT